MKLSHCSFSLKTRDLISEGNLPRLPLLFR